MKKIFYIIMFGYCFAISVDSTRVDTSSNITDILSKLENLEPKEIAKINKITDNLKNKIGISDDAIINDNEILYSQTKYYDELWTRYNRSEGLFLQINKVFVSQNIQGSSIYGGIGRAFYRNEYQWIIGLEQLLFNKLFQFNLEFFNKSMTPDAWKFWDGANSLSALFRKKDYYDWFSAMGHKFSLYFHLQNFYSIGFEYNQFSQSNMNNILENNSFNTFYLIKEGNNIFINNFISIGHPIDLSINDKSQIYTKISREGSIANSDINYTKDKLNLNLFIPYSDKLNFNMKFMLGASDVSLVTWDTLGYHQNIFELGGQGTLRGYDWKSIPTSHFQLFSIESWFNSVGLFFDRAIIFDSIGNIFNSNYFDDMFSHDNQEILSSYGLILGKKNLSLTYARQLNEKSKGNFYITFGKPLNL